MKISKVFFHIKPIPSRPWWECKKNSIFSNFRTGISPEQVFIGISCKSFSIFHLLYVIFNQQSFNLKLIPVKVTLLERFNTRWLYGVHFQQMLWANSFFSNAKPRATVSKRNTILYRDFFKIKNTLYTLRYRSWKPLTTNKWTMNTHAWSCSLEQCFTDLL